VASDVRRLFGSRGLIAAAAVLQLATAAAAGQARDYPALIDRYIATDGAAAVRELGSWPASAVNAASTRARDLPPARQRAAVMLHTDAAYAFLFARMSADASLHFTAARRILSAMRSSRADDRMQALERRWFVVVASMYTGVGMLQQAELTVRDGMSLYPRDARLYVMRGAVREMEGATLDPRTGRPVLTVRWFESASSDFLRAIAIDKTLALAYLHLGWVRLHARDDRCGADFGAALENAASDGDRYLAHMFLGAFAESQHRLEDARTEYEAALGVGRAFQTAYVALSRIEEALGHSSRAQELARTYAAVRPREEDPWWNYHLGAFDQDGLEWLHREARTP